MKKMAILISTLKIGGAEKQSIYLLNALKDKYKVFLIVFYGDIVERKNLQLIDGHNYDFIALNGNLLKKINFLYKFFKSQNITHLFTYLTKPNFYGAIIGKIAGVKNIYPSIRSTVLPQWKIALEKMASFFSTAVIFNSYCGESIFQQKGFKKTIVIPNCFNYIAAPLQRNKQGTIKIITVGRFVDDKDYFTALNAMKELRKSTEYFIFQIVGYGNLENKIRNKVAALGLSQYVEIIIKPDNIPVLLNEADIYLSTSLFEGTSNSIMEAMNACLPIVATKVGDNNRLVSEGMNGFLSEAGDYVSIAQSLKELINDYAQRIKFGLASHKILNENYSFEKFQDTYLKLVNKS